MTAFWISTGLLTLLVLAVLCWPLLRRHGSAGASRKAINTANGMHARFFGLGNLADRQGTELFRFDRHFSYLSTY